MSEPIEQVIASLTKTVEGWLTIQEGLFLYEQAKNCPAGNVIVEIGSWKGLSTICLGMGSRDGNKVQVYAIDPHHGANQESLFHIDPAILHCTVDEFMSNIRKYDVDKLITPIVNMSQYSSIYIVKRPVGFIFIDGIHDYTNVVTDIQCWYPKVPIGGRMAFHDSVNTSFQGCQRAVTDLIINSGNFENIIFLDCITSGKKIK